ncbi:hypothetical protein [Humidisolicoccus flavus]|uniref:hypothetical protein n=1 Tax=Humidisolicoccus flavus TaxID=3111414 RepID=UPI003246D6D7
MPEIFPEVRSFIDWLQTSVDPLPDALQVLAVFAIGMIPFLEGDVGAGIGIAAGAPTVATIIAATLGTIVVSLLALQLGGTVGAKRSRSARERRVLRRVEKWGIPIAMFIGGFLVSVPLNVLIMSAAGLNRRIIAIAAVATAIFNTLFVAVIVLGVLNFLL